MHHGRATGGGLVGLPGRLSVRTRIVAAAVLAVGAVLTLAAVLLVAVVGRLLERPMQGEARARAVEVAAGVERGTAGVDGRLAPLAAPWPTLAQLVDGDGSVLAASAELAGRGPLLATSPDRREPHGEARLHYGGHEQRFRLDAVATTVGGTSHTIVVATSLAQVDDATAALSRVLAVAVPLLVALVAGLAWLLVGRALQPVESLRAGVAGLAAGDGPRGRPAPGVPPPSVGRGADDEISRLAATLDDLVAELTRQHDTQRRFVADASHELRSPVANIRAAIEVARAHPASRPWDAVLDDVDTQNQRLARLIDDLLVLARVEAGELRTEREPVELGHLAASVVDEAAGARTPEGRAPVRIRLDRIDEAVVAGDEAQLRRVLVNLLDNARRHARTEVGVSVAVAGRSVRVEVRDDGPGVPSDQRAHIFQRFVRLDADRSRSPGPPSGSGLGLAIVADLVAAHGGTVTVAGGGPGAVFTVRLDLLAGPDGATVAASSACSQVGSARLAP